MNIPDEAARRYPDRVDDHAGRQEDRRMGFEAGAEWARKETLSNVVGALNENRLHDNTGDPVDVGYMAGLDDALEAVRGLLGGDATGG